MGKIRKIEEGDSGAFVADMLWSSGQFDYVIESEADWDALAAESVSDISNVLIKPGTYQVSDGVNGSVFGTSLLSFFFMEGAKLVSNTKIPHLFSECAKVFNPKVEVSDPWDNTSSLSVFDGVACVINPDISMDWEDQAVTKRINAFIYCENVLNPIIRLGIGGAGTSNQIALFSNCGNIQAPSVIGTLAADAAIYEDCSKILFPYNRGSVNDYRGSCYGIKQILLT